MERQTDKHKLVRSKWYHSCYNPKGNIDVKSLPTKNFQHFGNDKFLFVEKGNQGIPLVPFLQVFLSACLKSSQLAPQRMDHMLRYPTTQLKII